jgi:hypothetical protein
MGLLTDIDGVVTRYPSVRILGLDEDEPVGAAFTDGYLRAFSRLEASVAVSA